MRRAARVPLLAGAVALLLAAGAAGWTLWALPREALVADAERRLAAAGLSVVAEGTPELVLWPLPGVRLGPLRPGPGDAPALLAARTVVIGVAPGAIVTGAAAGRVRLSGATLELRDPRLPAAIVLTEAELTLVPQDSGALSLSGEGDIAGRRVGITAEIADAAALAAGEASAIALDLSTEGDRLRFSGHASVDASRALPAFAGTLAVESADPLAAAGWLADATGFSRAPARASACPPLAGAASGADGRTCASAIGALFVEATVDAAPGHLLARGRGSTAAGDRTIGMDATLRGAQGWAETGAATAELAVRVGGVLSAYWYPDASIAHGVWAATGKLDAAILDMAALRAWTGLPFADWPATGATSLSARLAVANGRATLSEAAERPGGAALGAVTLDFDAGGAPDTPASKAAAESTVPAAGATAPAVRDGASADTPVVRGDDETRPPGTETARNGVGAQPSGVAGTSGSERGDPTAASFEPEETANRSAKGETVAASIGPADASPRDARPATAAAPVSDAPGEAASATAASAPPDEDQRGAPLPPGTPPPPAPARRDPLTAPAPTPRVGPPLAPQVAAP